MIVVIPFCQYDVDLTVRVINWARKLDDHVPYTALLVHNKLVDPVQVRVAAEQYFAKVDEFVCSPWPGKHQEWPFPQNHTYQETCSYFYNKKLTEPWFWWEPDATPLKSGWLKTLEDEHIKGGKPYSGHIVGEPYGHMTGVGIYPWNVINYSRTALSATNLPWDMVSKAEVVKHCNPINHLIQHIWERDGGPCTFVDREDVKATVLPTAVIFHRCKDGSLMDMMGAPGLAEQLKQAAATVINTVTAALTDNIAERVTAVITSHNRASGLLRAHNSCVSAGFQHIIVAASGISEDIERVIDVISKKKHTVILRFNDEPSGLIWAKAVRSVKTEFCCILHDDDQYTDNLLARVAKPIAAGHKLVMWPGKIDNPRYGDVLNEIGADDGLNRSRLISNHLNHKMRSITPCRGCYPTDIAAKALEEAHREFDQRFYYRDKFLVGNDMLLWLRLTNQLPEFWCLSKPGVVLGTSDSCTIKDITESSNRLLDIYGHTREYWDTCPKNRLRGNVGVVGFIPDDDYPGVRRWLENMQKFPPRYPQFYIADSNGSVAKEAKAAKVRMHPDKDGKLCGSSIRFAEMIQLAVSNKLDYIVVNEPDVRVNTPYWDEQIADEFFNWPFDAVAGGCPVVWNPFSGHADRVSRILEWAHDYTVQAGVMPAYEITDKVNYPIIYPNGALGIWDVAEFRLLFPDAYRDPAGCYATLYPYDDKIGRMWWGVYEYRITRKIAWLTKAYSGCGDRWYNEAQRLHMLTSRKKIAVHQVKNNDL